MKKIEKIEAIQKTLRDCLAGFPGEVVDFLSQDEAEAKRIFRDAFSRAEGRMEEVRRSKEIARLKSVEMQECAKGAWKTFFGAQPTTNLRLEAEKLREVLGRLKKDHAFDVSADWLLGFLGAIDLASSSCTIEDLVLMEEKPRQLGFVRSPTLARLLEKTPARRLLSLTETLFVVNEELASIESKASEKGGIGLNSMDWLVATFPVDGILPLAAKRSCILEMDFVPQIKRIDLKLSYCHVEVYKYSLDDEIILAYGGVSPERKLLDTIFGNDKFAIRDEEYFKGILKKQQR